MQAGSFDFGSWPPSLSPVQLEALTLHATTYAISHGLLYLPPAENQPTIPSAAIHAPVSLFPSLFPRKLFELALRLQTTFNILYARIAMDNEFLDQIMGAETGVGKVDDFIGQLWTGWKQLRDEGLAQPLHLGLFRSDYLLHSPSNEPLSIKQVEFNTISVSFGSLSQRTAELHRYLLEATQYYNSSPYLRPEKFPVNSSIAGLAEGLAKAHKAYNVERSQVLFVVQPGERNVFDQRPLEYELLKKYSIKVMRQTFDELSKSASVDPITSVLQISCSPDLHPGGFIEISTVYFRSGYMPDEYPTPTHYTTRFLLERSKAIKCPTIALQLAGGKKVQEVLTQPGVLERFLTDKKYGERVFEEHEIKELRSSFMGMWGLDVSEDMLTPDHIAMKSGQEEFGVRKTRELAMSLVLKPQREGGGNNVYKEAIPGFLDSLAPQEREAWIAMELIRPPEDFGNYLIRAGVTESESRAPVKTDVVSELGILGWALFGGPSKSVEEKQVGWLVRTKGKESNEGGVATGFSVLDSLLLVSLLNPKFEGYKLELILQENAVSRFKLDHKPTQATASGKVPLSFQEMQSRITHNHLCVSDSGLAIYVDEDYNVCLVSGATTSRPSIRIIYQLPAPVDSSLSVSTSVQREYPSAAFISPQATVVADGNGLLYVIPIRDNDVERSEPIGVFTLPTGVPFRLHYLHRAGPTIAVLLLSSRYYSDELQNKHGSVAFDVWAVKIDLFSLRSTGVSKSRPLEALWHRRGEEVPVYTTFVDKFNAYLVIGGSSYRDPDAQKLTSPYEPTPDEIAPIPRANENLDALPSDQDKKLYPYSWTQSPDSITVAFPLPSTTIKTKIKVFFTMQTLTVHVDNTDELTLPVPIPIPHYSARALWADINPSSSFWTWDREGEQKWGLLTLHMEKKHEGTRWMHVFNPSPPGPATTTVSAELDMEVPETLDPSELWHIRESLEKYTTALRDGEDASGLGLGKGLSSLAEGEMDEEVDANIGRRACLTWVGGGCIDTNEEAAKRDEERFVQLLSTPLPGLVGTDEDVSLILKHDLDGTVFTLQSSTESTPSPQWTHTSTYSALSFVLASKQDTRFTYHITSSDPNSPSSGAVLAFEGGSSRGRGGNLYIYRSAQTSKEKWAKQAVLKVDDGSGGALLGVGCVKGESGQRIVVCLTEGELILIQGI